MTVNPLSKRPPVRYVGGKWKLAEWIISFFPPHDHYVEPFCGGASVLFRKYPSGIETINDLNSDVVNFFRVLRERPDALIAALELTPYAREEMELACYGEASSDPVEQARRFAVRAAMSRGGYQGGRTGWRYITNSHGRSSRVVREWNDLSRFAFAVNRLRNVQIEHDDALAVIRRFDTPKTLFYVDPPYVLSSRSERRTRYECDMDDHGHRALADVLRDVQGAVVLSGYASALYDELYAGWTRFDHTVSTNGNDTAVESVWVNARIGDMQTLPMFQEER